MPFEPITSDQRVAVAQEIARITKRWVLAFCQVEASQAWSTAFVCAGLEYVRTMIWVKPDAMPQYTGDRPGMGYESIVVAHPPGRKAWNGRGRVGVFECNKNGVGVDRAPHPTTKPLELMSELVSLFTDDNELDRRRVPPTRPPLHRMGNQRRVPRDRVPPNARRSRSDARITNRHVDPTGGMSNGEKRCGKCRKNYRKAAGIERAFDPHKRTRDGLQQFCRECDWDAKHEPWRGWKRLRADTRKLRIEISEFQYRQIIESNRCHWCRGRLFDWGGYWLDRLDSKKHYEIGNVVACCQWCNRYKNDLPEETWATMISALIQRYGTGTGEARRMNWVALGGRYVCTRPDLSRLVIRESHPLLAWSNEIAEAI